MTVLDLDGWDGAAERSGSLYSIPSEHRFAAARQLTEQGWWLHVDVLAAPVPDGVSAEELRRVRAELPDARVEVHVMDLGGDYAGALDTALKHRPDRMVLPATRCAADGPLVRATGAELWSERHHDPLPDVPLDGVLLMLIDPGTRATCDLTRLRHLADVPAGTPVGVDGGVSREHLEAVQAAGVRHVVVGRALLSQQHPEPPQRREEIHR